MMMMVINQDQNRSISSHKDHHPSSSSSSSSSSTQPPPTQRPSPIHHPHSAPNLSNRPRTNITTSPTKNSLVDRQIILNAVRNVGLSSSSSSSSSSTKTKTKTTQPHPPPRSSSYSNSIPNPSSSSSSSSSSLPSRTIQPKQKTRTKDKTTRTNLQKQTTSNPNNRSHPPSSTTTTIRITTLNNQTTTTPSSSQPQPRSTPSETIEAQQRQQQSEQIISNEPSIDYTEALEDIRNPPPIFTTPSDPPPPGHPPAAQPSDLSFGFAGRPHSPPPTYNEQEHRAPAEEEDHDHPRETSSNEPDWDLSLSLEERISTWKSRQESSRAGPDHASNRQEVWVPIRLVLDPSPPSTPAIETPNQVSSTTDDQADSSEPLSNHLSSIPSPSGAGAQRRLESSTLTKHIPDRTYPSYGPPQPLPSSSSQASETNDTPPLANEPKRKETSVIDRTLPMPRSGGVTHRDPVLWKDRVMAQEFGTSSRPFPRRPLPTPPCSASHSPRPITTISYSHPSKVVFPSRKGKEVDRSPAEPPLRLSPSPSPTVPSYANQSEGTYELKIRRRPPPPPPPPRSTPRPTTGFIPARRPPPLPPKPPILNDPTPLPASPAEVNNMLRRGFSIRSRRPPPPPPRNIHTRRRSIDEQSELEQEAKAFNRRSLPLTGIVVGAVNHPRDLPEPIREIEENSKPNSSSQRYHRVDRGEGKSSDRQDLADSRTDYESDGKRVVDSRKGTSQDHQGYQFSGTRRGIETIEGSSRSNSSTEPLDLNSVEGFVRNENVENDQEEEVEGGGGGQEYSRFTELDLLLLRIERSLGNGDDYEDLRVLNELIGNVRPEEREGFDESIDGRFKLREIIEGARESEEDDRGEDKDHGGGGCRSLKVGGVDDDDDDDRSLWYEKFFRVGRVRESSRRIDKNGKVKIKMNVLGIRCSKCVICLSQFKVDQTLVLLNCNHVFHKRCILDWIVKDQRNFGGFSCLVCKSETFRGLLSV